MSQFDEVFNEPTFQFFLNSPTTPFNEYTFMIPWHKSIFDTWSALKFLANKDGALAGLPEHSPKYTMLDALNEEPDGEKILTDTSVMRVNKLLKTAQKSLKDNLYYYYIRDKGENNNNENKKKKNEYLAEVLVNRVKIYGFSHGLVLPLFVQVRKENASIYFKVPEFSFAVLTPEYFEFKKLKYDPSVPTMNAMNADEIEEFVQWADLDRAQTDLAYEEIGKYLDEQQKEPSIDEHSNPVNHMGIQSLGNLDDHNFDLFDLELDHSIFEQPEQVSTGPRLLSVPRKNLPRKRLRTEQQLSFEELGVPHINTGKHITEESDSEEEFIHRGKNLDGYREYASVLERGMKERRANKNSIQRSLDRLNRK